MSGKFHIGQEVILRTHVHRGEPSSTPVTIARVGRKYAYIVRYGREVPFGIEDGIESGHGNYLDQIGTAEDFEQRDARTAAGARLDILTRGYSWRRNLTADAMTLIADIIEAAGKRP